MNKHDPLYDENTPDSGETLDDVLSDHDSGPMSANDSNRSDKTDMDKASEKVGDVGANAKDQADEVSDKVKDKASELGDTAQEKADAGMDRAASGIDSAADTLREKGEQQGGTAGNLATTVADKLDGASGYLRDKDSDQIVTDLEALVRRKPVESLLAAAGIGLMLSRIIR